MAEGALRSDRSLELEKAKSSMFPEQLHIWLKKLKKEKESITREDDDDKAPEAEIPKLPDEKDIPGRL